MRSLVGIALVLAPVLAMAGATRSLPEQDRRFLTEAAQADLAEMRTAKLALELGSSEGVRTFARRMLDEHRRSFDRLKQVADEIGWQLPTATSPEQRQRYDELSGKTGAAFDRAYLAGEVSDHARLVDEFEDQSRSGSNPELRNYARQSLPALTTNLATAERTARIL